MKTILLLLLSINVNAQTPYDVLQDKIIASLNIKSAAQEIKITSLIADSMYQAGQIARQANDIVNLKATDTRYGLMIISLNKDSVYQAKQIKDNYNYFVGQIATLTLRVKNTEDRSTGLAVRILALEKQVKDLQTTVALVNTLEALSPLKITRLGVSLTYRIEMLSATKNRDGYMTKELVNQIENNSQSAAKILKYNLSHSGNTIEGSAKGFLKK